MTLTGEGQYNINALKEIEATDSFLSLDDEIRGSRNSEESHDDCTTRLYVDNMRQKCGCLPFTISSLEVRTFLGPLGPLAEALYVCPLLSKIIIS